MTKTPTHARRKQTVDVTVERLSRVYAQAALDAAEADGTAENLVEELNELADEVLDRHPRFEALFGTELISREEKGAILDRVFSGRMTDSALGLLQALARHGRLDILRDVIRSLQLLWERQKGRVRVEVQFAVEPDEDLRREVAATLETLLGAEPVLTSTVDPDLIAGFVARVGDQVYDGSARSSLERTRQAMTDRAQAVIGKHPKQFIVEK